MIFLYKTIIYIIIYMHMNKHTSYVLQYHAGCQSIHLMYMVLVGRVTYTLPEHQAEKKYSMASLIQLLFGFCKGDAQTQSPTLTKIVHPNFPRLRKSQDATWLSAMHKSPPEGTAFLITVSPVPGKLTKRSCSSCFIGQLKSLSYLWFVMHASTSHEYC